MARESNSIGEWAKALARPVIGPILRHSTFQKAWAFAHSTFHFLRTLPQWLRMIDGHATRARSADGTGHNVLMLVVSSLRVDPRVRREAQALAAAGYKITIVWPDCDKPTYHEEPFDWGPNITFKPMSWQGATYIMSFPWLFGSQLLEMALKERADIVHAHDLSTSIVGLAAARHMGAKCVCDFHEWYSENVNWDYRIKSYTAHPWTVRTWYRLAERFVLKRADAVITVCDSIADELMCMAKPVRPVAVIRNIPQLLKSSDKSFDLRKELGIRADQFLLLWQGGIGPSRLIEPIVEALAHAPNVVFAIRSPWNDTLGKPYREIAERDGTSERLIFLDAVPSAEVVRAGQGADAGIWTLPNLSKNFYYALPNKVFEYLASGLPLLAANFPEVKGLVDRYHVGTTFDPYDPVSIAAAVQRVADKDFNRRCRENIVTALADLKADQEWDKLVALYDTLTSHCDQAEDRTTAEPLSG